MKEYAEKTAKRQIKIWDNSTYYDDAEQWMASQWENLIWPRLKDCNFKKVVDLAMGHGRNTEYLLKVAKKMILLDVAESNLEYCKERFKDRKDIEFLLGNGTDLEGVVSDSVTLVYCFDAMVHFDPEVVYMYLFDIARVLKKGGRAFLHHSNYSDDPRVEFGMNPHARNYMARNLFKHWAMKAGLKVVSSDLIPWGGIQDLDCITVLER